MKLRIVDRVMIAAAAAVLIVLCGAIIAEAFFGAPVLAGLSAAMQGEKAIAYVLMLVLVALSVCCVMMLIRRKGKRGFVMQDTDGGDLAIALPAVDGLVQQCVATHEEMQLVSSRVKCDHDGVTVDLRIMMANGVSVPLAIDALQKQIRQYVTSCTGVNVDELHVQVDAMDGTPVQTPYSVPAMLGGAMPMLSRGEEESAPEAEEKPLHQRLFSDDESEAEPAEAPAEEVESEPEQEAESAPAEPEDELIDEPDEPEAVVYTAYPAYPAEEAEAQPEEEADALAE